MSRDTVLRNIRRALRSSGEEGERRRAVADRLQSPRANIIPERGQREYEARIALFQEMAEAVAASVERVASAEDVPAAVSAYLRKHNLPATFRAGADPEIAALPWDSEPTLTRLTGASDGSDVVALSRALAGVAESGTLVLLSGTDNPTTLNFLPDVHIVMVAAADIAGDYEAVWRLMRERFGAGNVPRTINLVTGPSRSADIEQTLILGAHGPRSLHIIVTG